MENNQKKDRSGLKSSLKKGGYITAVTVIAIVVVVLVNLVVGQLPSSMTELDISDQRIYSVSDTSKDYLADLNQNIEIVILAEDGGLDERITKFIDKYAALSDHLTVKTIDPTVNPTALAEYEANSNTVVVRNVDSGKQKVLASTDLIEYDTSSYYYTGSYTAKAFDCDGQLTSAVDYVTHENGYKIYTMTGHGESTLANTLTSVITKANLTVQSTSLNMMTDGGIPSDCTMIISNAPTSDLSDDELDMLKEYMSGGGQVLYIMPPDEVTLGNWNELLSEYGLETVDSYIGDMENYYSREGNPFIFFPNLSSSSAVTSALTGTTALAEYAKGVMKAETVPDGVTVDIFMTTSASGFAYPDTENMDTYGIGATATAETESGETARLVVFTSSTMFDESLLTANSSLSNSDIFLNAVTEGMEDISGISIESKSLETTYNTVENPNLWGILFIAIIPLVIFIGGLIFWIRRRRQ